MEEETEVVVPETTEEVVETEETEEETVDSLKEKLAKANEIAENQKIRAEKAELLSKKPKIEKKIEEQSLSPRDTIAIMEAKISSEDLDEVVRIAKILGKPVSEALKDKTLKSIIADREETRRTANATMTKGGTRGASKVDGDDLLRKAESTGEVPDDEEGMQKLFMARMGRKTS